METDAEAGGAPPSAAEARQAYEAEIGPARSGQVRNSATPLSGGRGGLAPRGVILAFTLCTALVVALSITLALA
jgi:hypothetical protein